MLNVKYKHLFNYALTVHFLIKCQIFRNHYNGEQLRNSWFMFDVSRIIFFLNPTFRRWRATQTHFYFSLIKLWLMALPVQYSNLW